MSACPRCLIPLSRSYTRFGSQWDCKSCGGILTALPPLKRHKDNAVITELWVAATRAPAGALACPECKKTMNEVAPRGTAVDVCTRCYVVWFDHGELGQLPEAKVQRPDKAALMAELPVETRLALATARIEAARIAAGGGEDGIGVSVPANNAKVLFMILGLPVEHEPYRGATPFVTWTTVLLMLVGTLVGLTHRAVFESWALADADPMRHGGLTFLTAFFLHGSIMHFLGNAYFLTIFGDDVEDYLGPLRYVTLLAAATLGGDFLHLLVTHHDSVSVGASGGVSGVLAYYVLAKPKARLGTMVFFRPLHFPAWFAALFWTVSQLLIAAKEVAGIGRVSSLAHLGGALIGALLWWVWRPGARTKGVMTSNN